MQSFKHVLTLFGVMLLLILEHNMYFKVYAT